MLQHHCDSWVNVETLWWSLYHFHFLRYIREFFSKKLTNIPFGGEFNKVMMPIIGTITKDFDYLIMGIKSVNLKFKWPVIFLLSQRTK